MATALTSNVLNLTVDADRVTFIGQDFQLPFTAITSPVELDAEIAFGTKMDAMNEAVTAFGDKLLYLDIARIVHVAQQVSSGDQALKDAFNTACVARGYDAIKDEKTNPYVRHAGLLMSRPDGSGGYVMDRKWKNLLRAIRYLIEKKVSPKDVPTEISKATATDSEGKSLTRLLALNELDKKAHPPTGAGKSNPFGTRENEKAITAWSEVARLDTPKSFNFNGEGYALAVVRKGKDGAPEVCYDAALDAKIVMKAVREGFMAAKPKKASE